MCLLTRSRASSASKQACGRYFEAQTRTALLVAARGHKTRRLEAPCRICTVKASLLADLTCEHAPTVNPAPAPKVFTDKSGGDSPEAKQKKTSKAGELLKVSVTAEMKLPSVRPSFSSLSGSCPATDLVRHLLGRLTMCLAEAMLVSPLRHLVSFVMDSSSEHRHMALRCPRSRSNTEVPTSLRPFPSPSSRSPSATPRLTLEWMLPPSYRRWVSPALRRFSREQERVHQVQYHLSASGQPRLTHPPHTFPHFAQQVGLQVGGNGEQVCLRPILRSESLREPLRSRIVAIVNFPLTSNA